MLRLGKSTSSEVGEFDQDTHVSIRTITHGPDEVTQRLRIAYEAQNIGGRKIKLYVILIESDNFRIVPASVKFSLTKSDALDSLQQTPSNKSGDTEEMYTTPNNKRRPSYSSAVEMALDPSTIVGFCAEMKPNISGSFEDDPQKANTWVPLGYVERIDDYKTSALRCDYYWTYCSGNVRRHVEENRYKLSGLIARAKELQFPEPYYDPDATIVNNLCHAMNVSYIDVDFPPCLKSLDHTVKDNEDDVSGIPSFIHSTSDENSGVFALAREGSDKTKLSPFQHYASPNTTMMIHQTEWKRPSKFMKGLIKVFEGGITPSDILQGSIGNTAWLLAALAALTEFPSIVRELFMEHSRVYNPHGVYDLHLYKNGFSTVVRVDDYFPCEPGSGNGPKYSRCNGNELWVLLVEKAFAKVHGSYSAIASPSSVIGKGSTAEALMDLTGAPCRQYYLHSDHRLRAKVSRVLLYLSISLTVPICLYRYLMVDYGKNYYHVINRTIS